MAHTDRDGPDDSKAPRDEPGSVHEETPAVGQRIKGTSGDAIGDTTESGRPGETGEREDEAARDRQDDNDVA